MKDLLIKAGEAHDAVVAVFGEIFGEHVADNWFKHSQNALIGEMRKQGIMVEFSDEPMSDEDKQEAYARMQQDAADKLEALAALRKTPKELLEEAGKGVQATDEAEGEQATDEAEGEQATDEVEGEQATDEVEGEQAISEVVEDLAPIDAPKKGK